jgi:hypothetical protein
MGDPSLKITKETGEEMEILGFNIYRDDVQINEALINENSYIDNDVVNGTTYSYKVELVTDEGSVFSNALELTPYALPDVTLEGIAKHGAVELSWTIN